MRKHGGTPSPRDRHVTPAAISPPGVARGRLLGATSQVYRDVSCLPSSRAEPLPVRHRGDARGNQGAPPHDRVHLATYLPVRHYCFTLLPSIGSLFFLFFCKTSPKSLLESPQEASSSYKVSPTSLVTVSAWGSREEKGPVDSGFAFVQNTLLPSIGSLFGGVYIATSKA